MDGLPNFVAKLFCYFMRRQFKENYLLWFTEWWEYFHIFTGNTVLNNWASSWVNVSSGVTDQAGLQLACSATEASMRLEILVTETRHITLSRQRTPKALIRLRGMRRLIGVFVVCIRHKTRFLLARLTYFEGLNIFLYIYSINFLIYDEPLVQPNPFPLLSIINGGSGSVLQNQRVMIVNVSYYPNTEIH